MLGRVEREEEGRLRKRGMNDTLNGSWGILLDLLDMSGFNPPEGERVPVHPKDEELLHDDDAIPVKKNTLKREVLHDDDPISPIKTNTLKREVLHDDDPISPIKTNTLKRKERPTNKDVTVLVKTEHRSGLSMGSTKQSLSEKQAIELPEFVGENPVENLNKRGTQFQRILAAFEAAKSAPVQPVNPQIKAKSVDQPSGSSSGRITQMQRLFASLEAAVPPPFRAVNPQLEPISVQPLGSHFDRESHIRSLLASFEAAKSPPDPPVDPQVKRKCFLPLFPYFDWDDDDNLVVANLDSDPNTDTEIYFELDAENRVEHENRAEIERRVCNRAQLERRDSESPETSTASSKI